MHKLGGPSIHQCAKQRPHGARQGNVRQGTSCTAREDAPGGWRGGEVVGFPKGNLHERCTEC
jgi:hypothetical protein